MTRMLTDFHGDPDALKPGPIAIMGYGSQGRAHALNLRDSGHEVIVGARPGGKAETKAQEAGFETMSLEEAVRRASLIALLTPDMSHAAVYRDIIEPGSKEGATLMVAHGFSLHYGQIKPRGDMDVILIAPKGPGDLVRREFERGRGVPCLFAAHQDASGKARERALAYCAGIGGQQSGVIETTIAEETETDLFGEQAVLCGGATELVVAGYQTLVDAGYQPEVAYFECLHELKLIVDLLHEGGLAKMHEFISETAKYGDFVSGKRVITEETREAMRAILRDIQTGSFAKEWVLENQAGKPAYNAMLKEDLNHPIEDVGRTLRAHMPWLAPAQGSNTAA